MRLYHIHADNVSIWVGSKAEASSTRAYLVSNKGYKRADITTTEVDVPTDKAGLIGFLNSDNG